MNLCLPLPLLQAPGQPPKCCRGTDPQPLVPTVSEHLSRLPPARREGPRSHPSLAGAGTLPSHVTAPRWRKTETQATALTPDPLRAGPPLSWPAAPALGKSLFPGPGKKFPDGQWVTRPFPLTRLAVTGQPRGSQPAPHRGAASAHLQRSAWPGRASPGHPGRRRGRA